MKRNYLLSGITPLMLGCMLLAGCTSKDVDLYDVDAIALNEANKQHVNFCEAFITEFGTPAADIDWGFSTTNTTRSLYGGTRAAELNNEAIFELSGADIEALSEEAQCTYLKQLDAELINMPVDKLKAFGFKRIIAEDLAVTANSDFDYNDIVFDARRVEPANGTGFATFFIIARATGAHKNIYVGSTEDEGRFEIHELFGVPQKTFVNTVDKEQPKVHGAYWDKDHDPVFTILKVKQTGTVEPTLIDIQIYVDDIILPLTARRGEPAEKICVDTDFSWVKEKTKMRLWYPTFEHYVTNNLTAEKSWWHPTYWSDEEPNVNPNTGIPNDADAISNPTLGETTTTVPNFQASVDEIGGEKVIRLDITGIKNENGNQWLNLIGTDSNQQNTWVEVDGQPKGISIENNVEAGINKNIKIDVIFTVDNSGSMGQEADAIARDITTWANQLAKAGLNVRFGIVGYDGGITGAINLTTVSELSSYLSQGSGVNRTRHFGGANAETLQSKVGSYKTGSSSAGECSGAAVLFANDLFSFRANANRIYVNFTDEPNQPNNNSRFSVKFYENQQNWPTTNGTIHTVFSAAKFTTNNWNRSEQPWLMSDYTGGTSLFVNSSFTGVTLSSLPVTGALEHSSVIFMSAEGLLDGNDHDIHVTIRSGDGNIAAEKTVTVNFSN